MGGRYEGGRNNVAVVTQRTPDEVTAIPSPIVDGRAALGVRFDDDWYFTFHARPTGRNTPNNESDVMLTRIAAFVNRTPGRSWTVGADFNNEPGNFALPPGAHTYATGLPTHEGRRELDYVVASVNIPNHPRRRLNGASGDHWAVAVAVAVAVGGMRAGGEPQPLFTSPRHIENMQSGGTLEALGGGALNGVPALTNQRNGGFAQRWDLEFNGTEAVRIRLPKGRCLSSLLDRRDHGKPLMFDCGKSSLQRWRLLSFGNEQYQIRNIPLGLCLDAGTATSPRDLYGLELNPCKAKDNQHWFLGPPADAHPRANFFAGDMSIAHPGPCGSPNGSAPSGCACVTRRPASASRRTRTSRTPGRAASTCGPATAPAPRPGTWSPQPRTPSGSAANSASSVVSLAWTWTSWSPTPARTSSTSISANAAAPPSAGSSHPSTRPPGPTRRGSDARGPHGRGPAPAHRVMAARFGKRKSHQALTRGSPAG
ncbi:Deoxyribonuclease CdtB [Streptomyces netropsis]|nr:Deoxyribonuclease CdtB [Streptomyces netropsis]